jgi:type I restriction enzyme M protein
MRGAVSRKWDAYEDVPGFCKAASLEEIGSHNNVLTPGRYVGAADIEDDEVPFEERMATLRQTLERQLGEADALAIKVLNSLQQLSHYG